MYLLLAFLRLQSKLTKSMQQILRLLQLNLFEKRDMVALLRGNPPPDTLADPNQNGYVVKVNGAAVGGSMYYLLTVCVVNIQNSKAHGFY